MSNIPADNALGIMFLYKEGILQTLSWKNEYPCFPTYSNHITVFFKDTRVWLGYNSIHISKDITDSGFTPERYHFEFMDI